MSNLFKAEHPFSNYWTHQGGLAEVIGVLPSREQADILVAKFFDAVDPVYPMIHRETFEDDYAHFWSMNTQERTTGNGCLVALIFVMLAMGTQFVDLPSPEEKEQTAEFYNAWAFAGILQRQAYALGLNRDPSIVTPHARPEEMQQRRKVWQAVFIQDAFLSVIIKLPPTVTHTDVRIADLTDEEDAPFEHGATDTSFIRSMWELASVVQGTVCTPRSLDRAICQDSADRTRLVAYFQKIYMSLPLPFRTFNETAICELARRSRRLARQTLFLTSNYYHCLMLIYADEHKSVACDVKMTMEAAHKAISSYFLFHTIFDGEAGVWFHFQHRAFLEA
ncbi:MAG: hypothetical protein Q9173_001415, partial [Seirophora scorigena]